jgi:Gpi18-like mannosyltransferase
MTTIKYPVLTLIGCGVAVRILMHAILLTTAYLPPFDASHLLYSPVSNDASFFRRWASTALRWDAFYFSATAANGYLTEQTWAFFPGTSLVLRVASSLTSDHLLAVGLVSLLANACSLWSTFDLYNLTLFHTRSLEASFLASALSILPPSPVTSSHALCAEPFFAFFSYRGKPSNLSPHTITSLM